MSAVGALTEETLPDLLASHIDQLPICPFPALLDLRPVIVTAVLERTAVVQVGRVEEKEVVRQDRLLVEPRLVGWAKGGRYNWAGELISRASSRRGRVTAMKKRYGERAAAEVELREKLRIQGKKRCSCGHIGSPSEFASNGYCRPCERKRGRKSR